MSRSFLSALAGIAVTLLGWFGPWAWPAAPAFFVIHLAFGNGGFGDLGYSTRGLVIVGLIIINVSFWALVCYGAWMAIRKLTR